MKKIKQNIEFLKELENLPETELDAQIINILKKYEKNANFLNTIKTLLKNQENFKIK